MGTFTKKLPCKLSSRERVIKAEELAREIDQKARVQLAKKEVVSKFSEKVKEHDRRIAELTVEVREGVEYREIPCAERKNFENNVIEVYREDTGAVVSFRSMDAVERQAELFDPAPLDAVTEPGQPDGTPGGAPAPEDDFDDDEDDDDDPGLESAGAH